MVTVFTQLLERDFGKTLDPKAVEYIHSAVQGAKRMELLLNDLREYWSVDEERDSKFKVVSSDQAYDRALELLGSQIQETGAKVTREPLPDVFAEQYGLTLLFQNLISNAIKYKKAEMAPQVHVSASRDNGFWTIAVKDNGLGIQNRDLTTIFAPFKRLHGREYPGTGLGLAMCKKIVEKHEGRIWAESDLGQGSVFRFTLRSPDGVKDEGGTDHTD